MSHRKFLPLALAVAGTLFITTVSVPAAFATGTDVATQRSVPQPAEASADGDFIINEKGVLTGYRGKDKDVVIPDGVTEIGRRAFMDAQMDSVWIPASIKVIGEEAFFFTGLKIVTFQDDDAHPSQLTWVGIQSFSHTSLETVTLPRSVELIDNDAFSEMERLTSVHLGPNVKLDHLANAFLNSPRLTSIEVDAANATCTSVDGVVYSKDLSHLAAYPSGKNAGGTYAVPEGTTVIDESAFAYARLDSVTLPDTLHEVAELGFARSSLTSLTLPDKFETIKGRAFWYMSKLTRLNIGGTVTVASSAFLNDNALSEVNLRTDLNRLQRIGEGAFDRISARSITLPDSVTTVEKEAFARNSALTEFHLGASTRSIGDFALGDDSNLAVLSVSPANRDFFVDSGVLYENIAQGRRLIMSVPTNSASEFTVPAGTTEIGSWAFNNNTALRRVVLPEGLTTIGYRAFEGCINLTDMNFPDSVRVSRGIVNTGLDTVEYGTQIEKVWMSTGGSGVSGGRMVHHIIVHGGVKGDFYAEGQATNGRPESAFFGEGMKNVVFLSEAPRVLVLPSTLVELVLERFPGGERHRDTEVYVAAAKGSQAWKAAEAGMKEAEIDPSHLHPYEPGTVTLSGQGIAEAGDGYTLNAAVGAPTTVNVAAGAGVLGERDMRVVQVSADGSETVLQDWTAMSTSSDAASSSLAYTWTPLSAKALLRVDVRDASRVVRSAKLTVKGTSAPTPSPSPSPAPKEGQWKRDAGGWWYRYSNGTYPKNEKLVIGGQVYRFGADGYMRTGWVLDQGSWYYHGGSGAQATGWVLDGSAWYYLAPDTGAMATGWLKDGDSWYYLTPGSGAMATGTVWIGWRSYRFDGSGRWIG